MQKIPEVLRSFESIRPKIKGLNMDAAMEIFKKELLELCWRYELTPESIFDLYNKWKNKSKL